MNRRSRAPLDRFSSRISVPVISAGIKPREVADELGHSMQMTNTVYGHVIDEYAGQPPIDPDTEIRQAMDAAGTFPPRSPRTTK